MTVIEGTGGTVDAVFTVTLSGFTDLSVLVSYSTQNGTATAPDDYISAAGQLTFPAFASGTQEIAVVVVSDALDEGTEETFSVRLHQPINATISDETGEGTITDDDP